MFFRTCARHNSFPILLFRSSEDGEDDDVDDVDDITKIQQVENQVMEDTNNNKMRRILSNFVRKVYDETTIMMNMNETMMSVIKNAASSKKEFESDVVNETFYTFQMPMHQKEYKVQIFGNYHKAAMGYALRCRVFFEGSDIKNLDRSCTVTSGGSVELVDDIVGQFDTLGYNLAYWKKLFKKIESHVTPTAVHEG